MELILNSEYSKQLSQIVFDLAYDFGLSQPSETLELVFKISLILVFVWPVVVV